MVRNTYGYTVTFNEANSINKKTDLDKQDKKRTMEQTQVQFKEVVHSIRNRKKGGERQRVVLMDGECHRPKVKDKAPVGYNVYLGLPAHLLPVGKNWNFKHQDLGFSIMSDNELEGYSLNQLICSVGFQVGFQSFLSFQLSRVFWFSLRQ